MDTERVKAVGDRTAGVIVEVFPVGQPGIVGIRVRNTGPLDMTPAEMASALRQAAEIVEPLDG